MFTKQHYKAIAEMIRTDTAYEELVGDILYKPLFVDDLCRFFQADNPLFDRQRFLAACNES